MDVPSRFLKTAVVSVVQKCAPSYNAVYAMARPKGDESVCEETIESDDVIAPFSGNRARVAATPAVIVCHYK